MELFAASDVVKGMAALPTTPGGWRCIYADPPWMERGGGKIVRGAQRHYPLMPTKDISAMGVEVQRVAAESCHLWLWYTNNFMEDALEVVRAWGFRQVTQITWPKKRQGLGYYAFGKTEHCIFAVRGPTQRTGQTTTLLDPTDYPFAGELLDEWQHPDRKHSAKPPQMYERIETVTPGPRLELFSRSNRPGWTAWGNQVEASP